MSAYDRDRPPLRPLVGERRRGRRVLPRARRARAAGRWSSSASAPAGSPSRSPAAGIRVIGVDSSAGDARGRARSGPSSPASSVDLRYGDFRDPPVEGPFPLVIVPFRSLLHMQTDDDRRAVVCARCTGCSSRAARSSSTSSRRAPRTSPRRTAAGSSASRASSSAPTGTRRRRTLILRVRGDGRRVGAVARLALGPRVAGAPRGRGLRRRGRSTAGSTARRGTATRTRSGSAADVTEDVLRSLPAPARRARSTPASTSDVQATRALRTMARDASALQERRRSDARRLGQAPSRSAPQ